MTKIEVNGNTIEIDKAVIKVGEATIKISDEGFSVEDALGEVAHYQLNGYRFEMAQQGFFFMGQHERDIVEKWLKGFTPKTVQQQIFAEVTGRALETVDYDFQISCIEPSVNPKTGYIYFSEGSEVARKYSPEHWKYMATEYFSNGFWQSDLATLNELTLWYAYRVARGYWTIEYVCDDSSSAGNYRDSPDGVRVFTRAGKTEVGGFADGIGNTRKIIKNKRKYAYVGGYCRDSGKYVPVYTLHQYERSDLTDDYASGKIVLRRTEK
ncbi:MAG: hypothetical protein IJS47_01100 [Clostridia bacterium]|nr:hypothetical protein [Clostridia bacterium]